MGVDTYTRGGDIYVVTFTYKVDDHYYGGEFNAIAVEHYSDGGSIQVGYNPANPEENNLDGTGVSLWWYRLLGGVAIAIYLLFHDGRE